MSNGKAVKSESTKVKFIVVGLGRCGSNLLKFALKQNPQIKMTGEYYNQRVYPESAEIDGAQRARGYFSSTDSSAVGFKLFAHQGRKSPANSVWDYLSQDDSIRVIHLSRKNCFERVLSLEVANHRGQFLADQRGTDDILVTLSPEDWLKRFKLDEKREKRLERVFRKHPTRALYYEDLIANWKTHTTDLQCFLSVEPTPLEKTLKKQESKHPSQRCPNYDAIALFFRDTEYEWMFSGRG